MVCCCCAASVSSALLVAGGGGARRRGGGGGVPHAAAPKRADELVDVGLVRQLGQRLLQLALENVLLVLVLGEVVRDGLLLRQLVLERVQNRFLAGDLLVFGLHEEEVVGGADAAHDEDEDADLLRERQL